MAASKLTLDQETLTYLAKISDEETRAFLDGLPTDSRYDRFRDMSVAELSLIHI